MCPTENVPWLGRLPVEFDDPFNAVSYYFYDPDGNLLEFFSPNQADAPE